MTLVVEEAAQHNHQHHDQHQHHSQANHGDEEFFDFHVAASTSNQKMNLTDIETKLRDASDKYLYTLAHYIAGHINDTDIMDRLNGPILKGSIESIYLIFVLQYALLAMLGIAMNIAIIAYIGYHRLYRDVTHAFIVNLALCHVVQCAVVLPITLMVMLIQNWIFGQFLCFFLPMLQDIPLHVAMITHILIAWDRMRWLSDPLKCRFPAFVCCCSTWLTGMVIALPYPIYTNYVELGVFMPRLHGVGLCVYNLMDDMHEYNRGLFFFMYCGPAVLLAYIYIKTSQEIRPPEGPLAEYRAEIRMHQRNSSASSVERSYSNATTATVGAIKMPTYSTGTATRTYDLCNAELDIYREKRNQRNFGCMAAAQVVCICPLMVLRLARLFLEETYENQKHLDYTYLMFVWIAFMPTLIFPCIYATQILPRTERDSLKAYFHLSARRLPKKTNITIDDTNLNSSRANSIEKDESTNISQRTSIILNGDSYVTGMSAIGRDTIRGKVNEMKTQKYQLNNRDIKSVEGSNGVVLLRQSHKQPDKASGCEAKGVDKSNLQNYLKIQRDKEEVKTFSQRMPTNELKINVITDVGNKPLHIPQRTAKNRSINNSRERVGHEGQQKLPLDSLDNHSFSNTTASTYCNGNESFNGDEDDDDDADVSNFGDGDNSSIVSGMVVPDSINGNSSCLPPYPDSKKSSHPDFLRSRDIPSSDFSTYSAINSSSTVENDIINLLDKNMRERRRLPNVEKFCYRSPKTTKSPKTTLSTLSAKMPVDSTNDPLRMHRCSDTLSTNTSTKSTLDGEMPSDYFETDYVTTTESTPVKSPINEVQYQYCRRSSRKSQHHHIAGGGHSSLRHISKRDGFNTLQSNDLIAGAFGELDPTQPLTKMSVIENRVMLRRSSGGGMGVGGSSRSSNSYLSAGRSSLKSRNYDHNSSHSTQPELDFRENIFAEL